MEPINNTHYFDFCVATIHEAKRLFNEGWEVISWHRGSVNDIFLMAISNERAYEKQRQERE